MFRGRGKRMRKEFILVMISLLSLGLILHCGGSSSVDLPDLPDLAGTWEGTAWVDPGVFPIVENGTGIPGGAVTLGPACPSPDGFVDLELITDAEGDPTDLLICGHSVDSVLDTGITAMVDEADIDNGILWVQFNASATGEEIFYGGLFLDDSLDYAYFLLWDDVDDVVIAVVQRFPVTTPDYSESAMAGVWSGSSVYIDDSEWTWTKGSPLDVTLAEGGSLALTGTDPDGMSLTGIVNRADPNYGYTYGNVDILSMEIRYNLDGVESPDGEFFGGQLWNEASDDWIVIMMRRQVPTF